MRWSDPNPQEVGPGKVLAVCRGPVPKGNQPPASPVIGLSHGGGSVQFHPVNAQVLRRSRTSAAG